MKPVYDYKNYRVFLRDFIEHQRNSSGAGVIKRLSQVLNCHSTFVSQILKNKADLSTEQALRFCRHASFEPDETDFFMNLLYIEKAGDKPTKDHYENQIKKQLRVRENLKDRWQSPTFEKNEIETRYFQSILSQLIHAVTQIQEFGEPSKISKLLTVRADVVLKILTELESLGLVSKTGRSWSSTTNFLHLPKDSQIIGNFHSSWRQYTISKFAQDSFSEPGLHYSGVLTFSKSLQEPLRAILLNSLDRVMKDIKPSKSETAYALNLDFYSLLNE